MEDAQRAAEIRATLKTLIERIDILHEGACVVDGKEQVVRAREGAPAGEAMIDHVRDVLYFTSYTQQRHVATGVVYLPDDLLRQRFISALSAANGSRWSWLPKMRIVGKEGGMFHLESGGRRITASVADVDGPDDDGNGRLKMEKENDRGSAGWYWAFGEDNLPAGTSNIVRVYWSVSPHGAVPLVSALTRGFNQQGVPFKLKLLDNPQRYYRADTGVVYLPSYAWRRASPVIAVAHEAVSPYLLDTTPLFTRRLDRGLAIAEEPGPTGESFGLNRCRLVAEGLWAAFEAGASGSAARLDRVVRTFEENGLPLHRTHLRPDSEHEYLYPERMVALARGVA